LAAGDKGDILVKYMIINEFTRLIWQ